MNKKGISTIVATVLIILITVAAVTIIWAAVIPLVRNQIEEGTLCLEATSQLQILDSGYTCWKESTNGFGLQVQRGSKDFDLKKLYVYVTINGTDKVYNLSAGDLQRNGKKVFRFGGNDPQKAKLVTDIAIAPSITVGNKEKICDIASKMKYQHC